MTLKWKKEELKALENNPYFKGITNIGTIHPRKVVEKREKWCNGCNNAETSIRSIKKYSQLLNKNSTKKILSTIIENNLNNFTIKQILNILDPNKDLTDGSLQRKILAVLVAKGYLKKEIKENKNKRGEIKSITFIFNQNNGLVPPPCYDTKKDNHKQDWKNYRETRYFTEKYNQEEG